jgi:RNA:NAD 2'-phosphotransferase (TPT1/KptA family)
MSLPQRRLSEASKRLAWLLRHGARERHLPINSAGFAPVNAVLREVGLSRAELEHVLATNEKGRF